MVQFLRPSKRSLTNGQHFSLITLFVEELTAAQFAQQKLTALVDALRAKLTVEDKYMKIAQGSYLTKELEGADKQRDTCYGMLAGIVDQWLRREFNPQTAAAAKLKKILQVYKLDVRAQYDDESGVLDNLLQELQTEEARAAITTLQLGAVCEAMEAGNTQVKALLRQRDQEVNSVPAQALRTARQDTDKAYDDVIQLIEALALVSDSPEAYEQFVTSWNQTLQRYQDIIDRKSSGKGEDDGDDTPTPEPEPTPVTPSGGTGGDE